MKKALFLICFSFLALLVVMAPAEAIDINITNDWYKNIGEQDLASGTGSDLKGSYESPTNIVNAEVSNCTGNDDNWRVDIRRINSTWHNNFVISVKRTTDGTGGGSITGGTDYSEVQDIDQTFFSGSGNRTGIQIQYKLEGMSVSIPSNTYETSIFYTVVDTP